jgi:hypothetical protein
MTAQPTSDGRDLVDRLRSRGWEDRHHRKYREEAAREIVALRDRVRELEVRMYGHSDIPEPKS